MDFTSLFGQDSLIGGNERDFIFVEHVILHSKVGLDCWQRDKDQRVILSCSLLADTTDFNKHDDFTKTLDYRSIYNAAKEFDGKSYESVFGLARTVAKSLVGQFSSQGGLLEISLPQAILRCEGGVKLTCGFDFSRKLLIPFTLTLSDIKVSCIIGITTHERLKKQPIAVQLRIFGKDKADDGFTWGNLPKIFDETINDIEASSFGTVEALANHLAMKLLDKKFLKVNIWVRKPAVFGQADGPGVFISRSSPEFEKEDHNKWDTTLMFDV